MTASVTVNDVSTPVEQCILCGSTSLKPIVSLGVMALTGVFPDSLDEMLDGGPLQLVKCQGECGLVQLGHKYPPDLIYGSGYGYLSSLNSSMVEHLRKVAETATGYHDSLNNKLVIDIGANDGTLLSFFPRSMTRVGIDPTGMEPIAEYHQIVDFFPSPEISTNWPAADVVTSIAMFYDVDDPISFASSVRSLLSRDGVWITEQSYLPFMLRRCAYDTICHEHLAYYGLRQIKYIADKVGLKILDTTFDSTNGGSFCVTLARDDSRRIASPQTSRVCRYEITSTDNDALRSFVQRVKQHKVDLRFTVKVIRRRGQRVLGYGASTKGNVVLQYCGFGPDDIAYFAEINADKFGKYTPGSTIPIIDETTARRNKPDYFLVMPWHFKDSITAKEKQFMIDGGKLLFPLPRVDIWGHNGTHVSSLSWSVMPVQVLEGFPTAEERVA